MLNSVERYLRTPNRVWVLAVYAILIFVSSPLMVAFHFYSRWRRGDYPVEADSIGIPVLGYTILYLPLFLLLLCAGLQKYSGGRSIYVWNRKRPVWSTIWTIISFILGYQALAMLTDAIQGGIYLSSAFYAAQIHALFLLRSSAVSRGMVITSHSAARSDV